MAAKKEIYAQIGVRYYVVFDPLLQLQGKDEMAGALVRVWSISPEGYTELTPPAGMTAIEQPVWLNAIGLGLTLWEGQFEDTVTHLWLRWCAPQSGTVPGRNGQVISTGAERADNAEAKARRLSERLRAMGVNPDEV